MPATTAPPPTKGLQDVIAGESKICYIDGDRGILAYRGIDIHDLATKSSFEEVCYLLWYGKLPTSSELSAFNQKLAAERTVDPKVIEFFKNFPKSAIPMEVLRTGFSYLSPFDAEREVNTHEANVNKAIRTTSQVAIIVAAYDRIRKGKPIIAPDKSLSHAGNFLWMLNGEKPTETAEKALDIALILHADHELNASTFAARVIAATMADMHSAITGAIGALKGPLHGGANEAVMKILYDIDKKGQDPIDYIKEMLAAKKKVPGFGHRVYTTEDPRATHLRKMSHDLGAKDRKPKWYDMSKKIEDYMNQVNQKKLNANVDFYSASTYTTLGIDLDLFTPIFAISRISGWAAHIIEQHDDNRLIRPRAEYTGPQHPAPYVPVDQRK
jgi:citrate synthase